MTMLERKPQGVPTMLYVNEDMDPRVMAPESCCDYHEGQRLIA